MQASFLSIHPSIHLSNHLKPINSTHLHISNDRESMPSTRRSTRQAVPSTSNRKAAGPVSDDEQDGSARASSSSSAASMPSEEDDESGDEWRPERRRRGKRQLSSGSEVDDDDEDDEVAQGVKAGKGKQPAAKGKRPRRQEGDASSKRRRGNRASVPTSPDSNDEEDMAYDDEMDEEVEREVMTKQAADAWAEVRARKKAKESGADATNGEGSSSSRAASSSKASATALSAPPPSSKPSGPTSGRTLNTWLGLPSLPWPTSPASARITDRDSLFIAFVYPLTSCTPSSLARHLDHLSNEVHPTLPSDIFPSAFSHLDPRRRGSSHDVQAWRCLSLKVGRDGLGGPNDFGLEEGSDDDGERWGGDRVLKAMREVGAVDLLVVVSRWYGGTNLGPVRFEHMRNVAREALRVHMSEEALVSLREELRDLDEQIILLRRATGTAPVNQLTGEVKVDEKAYADLDDVEKAQRLVTAKKRTVEHLEKRKAAGVKASEGEPLLDPTVRVTPTKPGTTSSRNEVAKEPSPAKQGGAASATVTQTNEGASTAPQVPVVAGTGKAGDTAANDGGQEGVETSGETDVLAGWDDLA